MNALFPILAYHGCSRETAEDVVSGRKALIPSENPEDWLGDGIYFWENDPQRALEWAKQKKKRGKIAEPYVIGALIAPRALLDFSTREAEPFVEDAFKELKANLGHPLPKNEPFAENDRFYKKRFLDRAVMNALHTMTEHRFDVFSAPFLEGPPVYPTGFFLRQTHIQICVKDPSCIRGVFVPAAETLRDLGLAPLFS